MRSISIILSALAWVSIFFLSSEASAFLTPAPISSLSRTSQRDGKKHNNNDEYQNEDKSTIQLNLLGLMFPIGVAISANAPFLYVILNPPSADQREEMLMDFCKGDTCTLLGGGSGYAGGDAGANFIGSEIAESMPSVEQFEMMAKEAAEKILDMM